ncbi:MAG: PaaI family thioesterase [Deltaproteobacteria bacterium]|nr:PaaI family thioesterase [Deltaproteobacteria bacterium]
MSALPAPVLQLVDAAIVRSPYGKLLGLELVAAEPDRVRVKLPYRVDVTTLGDTVHGGAISGLVDSAATAAFWAHPGASPGARGTTIGFSINFVSAGRGQDLVADARVRRRGKEICTGEVSVTDAAGREVAVALVTYKMSLGG